MGQIAITWHTEDVLNARPDLTEKQAMDVLLMIEKNHDATIGINWDVIAWVADELWGDYNEV